MCQTIPRHALHEDACPRLHCVSRALSARLVTGTHKYDHGLSRLLHDDLHWIDVPERIQYKICVTVYRCLQSN